MIMIMNETGAVLLLFNFIAKGFVKIIFDLVRAKVKKRQFEICEKRKRKKGDCFYKQS